MKKYAELSKCRSYRYGLWRIWDENKPKVMFIGLNPSTADENKDDFTITRCISYAKQWDCGGIIVGNLFAYRATDPKVMKKARDPIGQDNDFWLKKMASEADKVVAIWSNHGSFLKRHVTVHGLFPKLDCLRITVKGQAAHVRGLKDGIEPVLFEI